MIFTSQLIQINNNNPTEACKQIANYIRQLQEELEYKLMHLDSTNISEIDLSKTKLILPDGTVFSGDNSEQE